MSRSVRRTLLLLTGGSCVGVVVELAFTGHWTELTQWIAWVALALVVASVVALLGKPNLAMVRVIRWAMGLVAAASLLGAVLHVHGNYEAAPLDQVYGPTWDSLSGTMRWWYALSQRVGPAPAVAPLILALLAALVALAATGLPDRDERDRW